MAKIAEYLVVGDMAELLSPNSWDMVLVGVPKLLYMLPGVSPELASRHALVKVDLHNTFNSIRRDRMLGEVHDLVPKIYSLVHSTYSAPSILYLGGPHHLVCPRSSVR